MQTMIRNAEAGSPPRTDAWQQGTRGGLLLPKRGAGVRHACPAPLGRRSYPGTLPSQHIQGPPPLPQALWAGLFRARAVRVRGRMILLARPVNQSLVQKEVFQQELEAV